MASIRGKYFETLIGVDEDHVVVYHNPARATIPVPVIITEMAVA